MHAIVRLGNGEYYVSAVFGYYNNITSTNDYKRYLERIHTPYYIVWNKDKDRLVKVFAMKPNTKYLIPQILIVDATQERWIMDKDGIGGVDFLPRELADDLSTSGILPQDIREQCDQIEGQFTYEKYREIKTEQDITNFYYVSGDLHDAWIKEEQVLYDGSLYVFFDGTWGCKIEMWFSGDVEYDTSNRNPDECDPSWYASTLLLQDGFVYLIDDEDVKVENIGSGYCWFKARHMKYHVIPD